MAAPVTRIQPVKLPTLPAATTPEQHYWRSFKSPLLIHEYASITHIHFSAQAPHDFAITSSTLVKIFSSSTRTLSKTISRFKETAYSGTIRRDGRTLAAGDASGRIQVFDLSSRAILRTWEEHRQPVHVVRWSPRDLTTLLSASDDATLRLWDLPSGESTLTFAGHSDYVRAATFLPNSPLVASGGYDGSARLFDARAGASAVLTLRHAAPVEAVLAMPAGTTLLAAAGPAVYVWDVVAAKAVATLQNHQKTVTALALTAGGGGEGGKQRGERRVLTGGLDGHVKIYEPTSWKVTHGIKYPAPILAVGVAPDEKHLAVGMVDGLLSIRTRTSGRDKHRLQEKERALDMIAAGLDPRGAGGKPAKGPGRDKSGNRRRRLKGMDFKGEGADVVVPLPHKKPRESAWEKELRHGRYADALDRVLASSSSARDPTVVYTCFNELRYRNALAAAVSNRDEEGLRPVVEWICRFVKEPRFVDMVVDVGLLVLDLYSHALGQSPEFDGLVEKLRARVAREVDNSKAAWKTVGMLGMLLAGTEVGAAT